METDRARDARVFNEQAFSFYPYAHAHLSMLYSKSMVRENESKTVQEGQIDAACLWEILC